MEAATSTPESQPSQSTSGEPSAQARRSAPKNPKNLRKQLEQGQKPQGGGGGGQKQKQGGGSAKLRGLEKDPPAVRLSKTLSWLLRHGAQSEGLPMRPDGYVNVVHLLANPKIKSQALELEGLKEIVKADLKQRYDLMQDAEDVWWIRANQGHSIKSVKLDLKPILTVSDLPTGVAVHGTTKQAWEQISKEGLSKMKRNHIHLAQGVPGNNVISGMRNSSQILIWIDVQKAIDAGIKFHVSDNGVVLTEGNEAGMVPCEFFQRVEDAKRVPLPGWEGTSKAAAEASNAAEPLISS
ncbi:putative RNA 2'-phosphotransferase, Tpt1 / KptA family protein [Lyophyllum shimeji]|uniref:2'-phosphotransferase n=1 Tax=Lyophyllum shimeji TaxID=47721 RepID=A0A9P3PXL7_LYOSH|nr:putative RNA 2'-phosphotransferase, Tpt1 / KptA family protein [Lyophyllum shimeji]